MRAQMRYKHILRQRGGGCAASTAQRVADEETGLPGRPRARQEPASFDCANATGTDKLSGKVLCWDRSNSLSKLDIKVSFEKLLLDRADFSDFYDPHGPKITLQSCVLNNLFTCLFSLFYLFWHLADVNCFACEPFLDHAACL